MNRQRSSSEDSWGILPEDNEAKLAVMISKVEDEKEEKEEEEEMEETARRTSKRTNKTKHTTRKHPSVPEGPVSSLKTI